MRSRMGEFVAGRQRLRDDAFSSPKGVSSLPLSLPLPPLPPAAAGSNSRSSIDSRLRFSGDFASLLRMRLRERPRSIDAASSSPVRARDRERSIRDLAQRRAALVIIRENRMLPPPSLPTSSNLSPSSEPIQTLQYLLTDSENKRETVFPHPEERRKQVIEKAKRIFHL